MHSIDDVLDCLNSHEIRATYAAVAEVVYGDRSGARTMGRVLRVRTQRTSWVVNARTRLPTGHSDDDLHPNLLNNPAVIRSGMGLRMLMNTEP